MSEMRDLNQLREQWSEHAFIGAREEVLHIIDRAIAAEKEVARLIAWHNRETKLIIDEKNELQKRVEELEDLLDTVSDRFPHYSNVYRKIQDTLLKKDVINEAP